MPKALFQWAIQMVKQHPIASDSMAVIPSVVVGGNASFPDVTLGELREWTKSDPNIVEIQKKVIENLRIAVARLAAGASVQCIDCHGSGKLANYNIDGTSLDPPDPTCGLCEGSGSLPHLIE